MSYFPFNPNAPSGIVFLIGSINNFHFQSLVPVNQESVDFEITNSSIIGYKDKSCKSSLKKKRKTEETESDIRENCLAYCVPYVSPASNFLTFSPTIGLG